MRTKYSTWSISLQHQSVLKIKNKRCRSLSGISILLWVSVFVCKQNTVRCVWQSTFLSNKWTGPPSWIRGVLPPRAKSVIIFPKWQRWAWVCLPGEAKTPHPKRCQAPLRSPRECSEGERRSLEGFGRAQHVHPLASSTPCRCSEAGRLHLAERAGVPAVAPC